MRQIIVLNPHRLVFGNGCLTHFVSDIIHRGVRRLYVVAASQVSRLIKDSLSELQSAGIEIKLDETVKSEPTVESFIDVLENVREFHPDTIAGIGGGSVLDVAKLVAAFQDNDQRIQDVFGIGLLSGRKTYLVCIPTTAGTGSEVSPNAILLDTADNLKKGVISPYLVPDAAYVDPELTITIPPKITAETGVDALTHCIEAYANNNAHPMIDMYALEGIKLISTNLKKAYDNGADSEARAKVLLGSLYGGICLGPVNTAAVHALSYPLGGRYHIAHGLSNALLLPHVMEFNLVAIPERYADIARALGIRDELSGAALAIKGVEKVKQLLIDCGITVKLSDLDIPDDAFEEMAESALSVTRFLKNNPRALTKNDIIEIYQKVY